MARPNIAMLNMPPLAYRPDRRAQDFESRRASEDEDQLRANRLKKFATVNDGALGERAVGLANLLQQSQTGNPPDTPASKLYMRDQRIRIFGQLWKLINEGDEERVSTFTVVKRDWLKFFSDLDQFDPATLKNAFRTDLYRCGAAGASGWLFCAWDCEFHPALQCYQPHIHGVAAGGMIDVLDTLRDKRGYKAWDNSATVPGCATPVRISRQTLTNMPSCLSYILKGFWKVKVGDQTRRIAEPFGSSSLLQIHMYHLKQLTMLLKLSIVNGELVTSS